MFYDVNPPFTVTSLHRMVLDRTFRADFHFDGEKHDFWEVVYVLSGKLEVTEDENVYVLGERDIIFHAPDEFHRLRSVDNTRPHVLNFSFRAAGEVPAHLTEGVLNLSPELHSEYVDCFSAMRRTVRALRKETEPEISMCEVTSRLTAILMRLTRESSAKDSVSTSAGAKSYSALVELMHKEVRKNLSLEDFAKISFISVSYIKKLFSRYAGISPKSYYANLRTAEARRLLQTDIPVYEVSEMMNFSSAGYFTIFFKNQTGQTPMEFKKMQNEKL
ncbi:MAG: helix-turn-helix domain-containing protein [Clostridia bacterium]|nr:helix-turn-helix domain-containing protein [Clostridia bacterium]